MTGWISIKDALPEYDKWVILTNGNCYGFGLRFIIEGDPKNNLSDSEAFLDYMGHIRNKYEITHWAYAPEFPKDE